MCWKDLSRKTVKLGKPHTKLHITVTNSSGDPIRNAVVQLLQNNHAVYKRKTTNNGTLTITRVRYGDYDINVGRKNFISHSEPAIHFAPGSEVSRSITLQFLLPNT